jgi:hypothetical protein
VKPARCRSLAEAQFPSINASWTSVGEPVDALPHTGVARPGDPRLFSSELRGELARRGR